MNKLENWLDILKGARILNAIAGGNFNGSVVVLEFEHNYSLTIQCVWRLSQDNQVLASWNEKSNEIGSNFESQISALKNDIIIEIEMSNLFDLNVKVSSGKMLQIFTDINQFYSEDNFDENWYLCNSSSNICYGIKRLHSVVQSNYS